MVLELVVIRQLLAGQDVARGKDADAQLVRVGRLPLLGLAVGRAAGVEQPCNGALQARTC